MSAFSFGTACPTNFQALAPHNPLFFEEVLVHGQNPALSKAISDRTDVPLATGERMFTIEEFRDLFETRVRRRRHFYFLLLNFSNVVLSSMP